MKYKSARYPGPITHVYMSISFQCAMRDGRAGRGVNLSLSLECAGEILPILCPGFFLCLAVCLDIFEQKNFREKC